MQTKRLDTEGGTEEAELSALLATLRMEQTPEADFEQRFLYDFHESIVREAVCCPARRRCLDHLLEYLAFGRRKWAYSASTLGLGAVAIGFFSFTEEHEAVGVAVERLAPVAPAPHLCTGSLVSLSSGVDIDTERCTTIQIGKPASSIYDGDSVVALSDTADTFYHTGSVPTWSTFPRRYEDRTYPLPSDKPVNAVYGM